MLRVEPALDDVSRETSDAEYVALVRRIVLWSLIGGAVCAVCILGLLAVDQWRAQQEAVASSNGKVRAHPHLHVQEPAAGSPSGEG